MANRSPGEGQVGFQGVWVQYVPHPNPHEYDPNRRRAFGSIARILGVSVEVVGEPEPGDEMLIDQDYLHASLFGVRGDYNVDGLAVNESEYGLLVRSPKAFQAQVSATTERATKRDGDNPVRAEEKRLRSEVESFASKLPLHQAALHGLETEVTNLGKAKYVASGLGYVRVKTPKSDGTPVEWYEEMDLQLIFAPIWEGVFPNMLAVVAKQRNWTEDQKRVAQDMLKMQLFTGPQKDRMEHWHEKLDLAHYYATRRRVLFANRTNRVESQLTKNQRELNKYYADNGIDPV